jgi:hypothetical protein
MRILILGSILEVTPRSFYLRSEVAIGSHRTAWQAPQLVWTTQSAEESCHYRDPNSGLPALQPVASRYTE